MANDEHSLLLGEIKGKLEMLTDTVGNLADGTQRLDERLGKLETRAAAHGALAGGLISVGLALIIEKIKSMTGMGGA
ncbi:MAG: hypothetical protein AB1482_13075 [Pseudomonadota bacterium]